MAVGCYFFGFFLFFVHLFTSYSADKKQTAKTENKGITAKIESAVEKATAQATGSSTKTYNSDKVYFDANGNEISPNTAQTQKSQVSYKGLKSLAPADVYPNFEENGFKIDKKISMDGSFFYCTKEFKGIRYDVSIYSEDNVNEITEMRIQADRINIGNTSKEDMKQFLKYGVSLPYDQADVEKVQNFIDKNYYNNKASISISGVKFTIYCPTEFMRLVTIQNE